MQGMQRFEAEHFIVFLLAQLLVAVQRFNTSLKLFRRHESKPLQGQFQESRRYASRKPVSQSVPKILDSPRTRLGADIEPLPDEQKAGDEQLHYGNEPVGPGPSRENPAGVSKRTVTFWYHG